MYVPVVASVFATVGLIVSVLPMSAHLRLRLAIGASFLLVLSVLYFLVEITPIASGNNDSGEVFWIVMIPAILLCAFSFFSYLKAKKLVVQE